MTEHGCNSSTTVPATTINEAYGANDEWDADTDIEQLHRLRAPVVPGLHVTKLPAVRYQLLDLLQLIIPNLSDRYDTTFLSVYCNVLKRGDEALIQIVTNKVLASVEEALRACEGRDALGEQRVPLAAWLSAGALSACGRVRGARPALRQLLARCSPAEREVLAAGWWRALPSGALVALSDAVRAPRAGAQRAAPSLAELLLRGAMCRPPPAPARDPSWAAGAPRLEELEGAPAAWGSERAALFGRVLAAAPRALRAAPLRRLASAERALSDDCKAAVWKLQILFGSEDKILTPGKRRRGL